MPLYLPVGFLAMFGCWCYESVHCTTKLEVRVWRGLDSGFSSCAVPTYYCGSKYFYNQHPKVWKLIGTKCSLNRGEHRVIIKLEVFPIVLEIRVQKFRVMLEVTRGQVDNENNSQSQYLNISNKLQSESLIYEPESIAVRNGKYWNMEVFPIDPGIGLWKPDISNIWELEIRGISNRWELDYESCMCWK